MKLVIDIPQTMIDELRDGCFGIKHNVYELAGVIMGGTVLEAEQEPCEDCISRKTVIERIQREEKVLYTPTGMNYLIRAINELPPVTPKEQKAETVTELADRCKECGARYGRLLQDESRIEQKIRKELSLLSTYRMPNSTTDLISYRAVERVLNLVFRGDRDLEPYKESEE